MTVRGKVRVTVAVVIVVFVTSWGYLLVLVDRALEEAGTEITARYEVDAQECRGKGGVPIRSQFTGALAQCEFPK